MSDPEFRVVPVTPEMIDQAAKAAFGITQAEAWEQGICIECKRRPTFSTDAGRREYRISAMCETCFDTLFKEEE